VIRFIFYLFILFPYLPHYFVVSCMHMYEGLQVPVLGGPSTTECMQLITPTKYMNFNFKNSSN